MKQKDLQPCEMKVMNVVWDEHPIRANRIAAILMPQTGWSKNTIYTLITRIIAKGLMQRTDPGFVCEPLITREEIQRKENQSFLDLLYKGSAKLLFARMLGDEQLSKEDLAELREMLDRAEQAAAEQPENAL